MAQRRIRNHRKGNEILGAESDELMTVKISRLESEIANFKEQMAVKIMEVKIDSLEKQNASFNRQIIELGKKYGLGCARLFEGNRIDIRKDATYPGKRGNFP